MIAAADTVQVMMEGRLVDMPAALAELTSHPPVQLAVDGKSVEVPLVSVDLDPAGRPIARRTSIYDAAKKAGIDIPILCHREYMTPVAVCRVCCVRVGSEGRLAPACYRPAEQGMVVSTHRTDDKVRASTRTLVELLMADHGSPCKKHQETRDCELELLAQSLAAPQGRMPPAPAPRPLDESSLVIAVDHNACILCDRCVRGCNEIRHNEVIGRRGKGYTAGIAFDLNTPMGESSCVACGECMVSCPTGALTFRNPVQPDFLKDTPPPKETLAADDLAKHPFFEGVARAFLHWNEGSVVRRFFRKGDVICREGEYGSTAFYLERGSVQIAIRTPFKHAKALKDPRHDKINWGPFGLIRKFKTTLVGPNEERRPEEGSPSYIHIDAPVALAYGQPVATLGPGEIFGEMTCMSAYPRSATVVAEGDCVVLEMLRNVLYILQRSRKSRKQLEDAYRKRSIDTHLRSVPLFADLLHEPAEFEQVVDFLRARVQLLRLVPGDVICRQGETADALFLVRIGFVKVSQARAGGEQVLSYIGPGGFFGEIGLMAHVPEVQAIAPGGVRVATCAALDHVDLVRIDAADFHALLEQYPAVRRRFVDVAIERLQQNEELYRQVERIPLGSFLEQGLMEAQSLLVLDLERCTRCDECTKACADSHQGVTRLIREGLRFDKYLVASSCRSCLDPYCMVGCPVGSIRRRNSREIIIEDWCIGCGKCAENCPYGNINMHTVGSKGEGLRRADVQKATTCDLCTSLDGQPSCVYACPHDAAFRMSGKALLKQVTDRRGGG
jgi:CRP-like cAMP-binding protein/Fe-S-cluster-containing dehydrogenase component